MAGNVNLGIMQAQKSVPFEITKPKGFGYLDTEVRSPFFQSGAWIAALRGRVYVMVACAFLGTCIQPIVCNVGAQGSHLLNSHLFPCLECLPAVSNRVSRKPTTTSTPVVTDFEIRPMIAVQQPAESVKIIVGVTDTNVSHIAIDTDHSDFQFFVSGTVLLRDDGADPDAQANDGLFTANLDSDPNYQFPIGREYDHEIIRALLMTVHYKDLSEDVIIEDVAFTVGMIKSRQNSPIIDLSGNAVCSDRVVNLIRPDLTINQYPNKSASQTRTCREFYKLFSDRFDWITFVNVFSSRGAPAGRYSGVRNSVQGIGRLVYDESLEYGSHGALRGLIFSRASQNSFLLDVYNLEVE